MDRDLLAAVLAAIDEGVVVLDRDGSVAQCSEQAMRLLGVPDVDLVGRPWAGVLDELRQGGATIPEGELDAYGPSVGELTLGAGRVVAWRRRELGDGRALHVLRDISELRGLEADLRRVTTVDVLTGALNRRRFYEAVEQEVLRGRRYGRPVTVAVLNVDRFADLNDEQGFRVGDQVLAAVAERCREALRASDSLGRLAGGEFGALLPETGGDDALVVAERLRLSVAGARVMVASGAVLHATVSIGVAAMRSDDDVGSLLQRAERAMRRAKDEGRDRVALAVD